MSTERNSPEQQTNIVIKQINLAYHTDQDRILLRVGLDNDTELVLWLTYRVAKSIWALLNGGVTLAVQKSKHVTEVPEVAVAQFQEEVKVADTLKKLDFSTEYQPPKEMLNKTVMLATKVNVPDNHKPPKALEISCLEGMTIRLNLNQEITLAICNMLQLTSKEACWDISGNGAASSTMLITDSKTKQVLH